jgi:hypothetical protein
MFYKQTGLDESPRWHPATRPRRELTSEIRRSERWRHLAQSSPTPLSLHLGVTGRPGEFRASPGSPVTFTGSQILSADPAPPISLSSSCSSSLSLSCSAPLIVSAYSARSFGPVSRSSILAYMFRHSWHSADPTEELHVICLRPSLRLHFLKMLAAPSKPCRDPIASARAAHRR